MPSIFTKILTKQIPGEIVYEDDFCAAIRDVQPQAPIHVLLVPKKEIPSMAELKPSDSILMGHMMLKAAEVAASLGLAKTGYRLVINTKKHGGQSVDHIHIHILGGRQMEWPPG